MSTKTRPLKDIKDPTNGGLGSEPDFDDFDYWAEDAARPSTRVVVPRAPRTEVEDIERSQDNRPAHTTRTSDDPSPAQVAYHAKLVAEKLPTVNYDDLVAGMKTEKAWTKSGVSKAIDHLMMVRTPVAEGGRTNQYAGTCDRCGNNVAANAGLLIKNPSGGWITRHKDGDCTERVVEPTIESDIPEGHYALDATDDDGHTVFYRVDRPVTGKWAGRMFVKLVVGGQPDTNVSRGQVQSVLDRITEAGAREAAIRYGMEIGRCSACNRVLTNEKSREAGIGAWCASQRGWA